MTDCNSVSISAYTTDLGLDTGVAPFNESWKYSTVLCMLMYLASNSCPNIEFSVHQCECFTHVPRQLHAKAVKNYFLL